MDEKGEKGFEELAVTNNCITAKGGLLLFVKLAKEIGLKSMINSLFGRAGSNRGIRGYDYVMSILLMLIGGGRYLEDIRQIRMDKGIREVCGIKKVPSADGIARFLQKRENIKK